jgi:hypothetical protein
MTELLVSLAAIVLSGPIIWTAVMAINTNGAASTGRHAQFDWGEADRPKRGRLLYTPIPANAANPKPIMSATMHSDPVVSGIDPFSECSLWH